MQSRPLGVVPCNSNGELSTVTHPTRVHHHNQGITAVKYVGLSGHVPRKHSAGENVDVNLPAVRRRNRQTSRHQRHGRDGWVGGWDENQPPPTNGLQCEKKRQSQARTVAE